MSIYKRGDVYWYKFMWHGELIRESTKVGNPRVARQMEAAHRTSLAKGEVGIRERKPIPTLSQFCTERFKPWAKATFEEASPRSWEWYRVGLKAIEGYKPLWDARLSEVNGELIADFAAHRQGMNHKVSSINSVLRVLRRALRLAVEWGAADKSPKVKLLPGERHREHVVTAQEEGSYLKAAEAMGTQYIEDYRQALGGIRATQRGEQPIEPRDPYLLRDVATVLLDSGLRPEECSRLRWEAINWQAAGKAGNGTMLVTHGKTAAARRLLPMTPRVRFLLETRWEVAGKPEEGWVWPALTKSGHIEPGTLKRQHRKAVKDSKVRPFVLYSLRHTFLTRLGESGCDVWTLARIAGHSSIAISARYVHPSEDAVLNAMARLGGHKIGHSEEKQVSEAEQPKQLTSGESVEWMARPEGIEPSTPCLEGRCSLP